MEKYTKEILLKRINAFKTFYNSCALHKDIRRPNFPEDISENIVRLSYFKDSKWKSGVSGDLVCDNFGKIEVKCVNSTGPISFGPTEKWDILCIVDARLFIENIFTIHKINIKNDDFHIQVSKKQSYKDQVLQKRRPRICLKNLLVQIKDEDISSEKIILPSSSTTGTETAFPTNL